MKASILAAGSATRMRPHTEDLPKALLEVAGTPILKRAITNLRACGVEQFYIGTGYLKERIVASVTSWFPELDVTYIENPDFATTNTAYSLGLMSAQLRGHDFLKLNGDVVFEPAVIKGLMGAGGDHFAIRSEGGIGDEEMKIEVDGNGRILAISKEVPLEKAVGESVGIEFISAATSLRFFDALRLRAFEQGRVKEYYEAAFQHIIDDGVTFRGYDIGTKFAMEIDFIEDYRAANARMAQLGM